MKKIYSIPSIHVQMVTIQNMIAASPTEGGFVPGEYGGGDAGVKEDFDNFFE